MLGNCFWQHEGIIWRLVNDNSQRQIYYSCSKTFVHSFIHFIGYLNAVNNRKEKTAQSNPVSGAKDHDANNVC